jgi:hypothetical protein
MLKRLLLGLLVLWSGVSLLGEARRALASWDARADWETAPGDWRLGSLPVARLKACLDEVRRFVPAGSNVAYAPPPGESVETVRFEVRWVAYLMPEQNVFRLDEAAARYVLSWRLPLTAPRFRQQTVRPLPYCFLYEASRP